MNNDRLDAMGAMYNRIGTAILRSASSTSNHLWLYAVAGDNWVEEALFLVGDGTLTWVDADDELFDLILDLWEPLPLAERWEAMVFEVQGTKFTTEFFYEGDLPPDDTGYDRREELIRRRFGNYEVVYPPLRGASPA